MFSRGAFDPLNLDRLIAGENCIQVLDDRQLEDLIDKNVVVLKKDKATGVAKRFPQIRPEHCVKLAALLPPVDLTAYGVDPRLAVLRRAGKELRVRGER